MIIGVDVGYGYTKAYRNNKSITFPSLVAFYKEDTFQKLQFIEVEGTRYLAGNQVTEAGFSTIPIVRDNFYGSKEYIALVGKAIAVMQDYNDEITDVSVVLGLPPGLFSQRQIDSINMKSISVKVNGNVIKFSNVFFVPQGLGAYMAYVKENNVTVPLNSVLVIDIGYYTVDFVSIVNGKYAYGKAMSFPDGVKILYDEIKDELSKKTGIFFDDVSIQRTLRYQEINHLGETIYIDPSEHIRRYVDLLTSRIREYARNISSVNQVLLAGGGASILGRYFTNATIINSPETANARGYFYYGVSNRL